MKLVLTDAKLDEIRQLFGEDTAMRVKTDKAVQIGLAVQGDSDELDHVEKRTVCPTGGYAVSAVIPGGS